MASIGPEAMNAYTTAEGESSVTDGRTDLEQRDVRALTECMTVLPLGGDVYSVTTDSGSEYRVDALEGRCSCPDKQHNLEDGELCKHERRVRYAIGETPIPAWVDADAIDDHLGDHTDAPVCRDSSPTLSLSDSSEDTAGETVQTDGGVNVEKAGETVASKGATNAEAQYTYHYEPAHVGGERYVRCEKCGAECIPAKPDRMFHREGCSEGDR